MRRLLGILLVGLLAAACGDADATSGDAAARRERAQTANIRIDYGGADGAYLWTISQLGTEYLAFVSETEHFISMPEGDYSCVGVDTEGVTCEEVPDGELEFGAFGPSLVYALTDRFAREPTLLRGQPFEKTIAGRTVDCYRLDAARLLEGSGVDDPDARACFDVASGWVLELIAADNEGGIAFRAIEVGAPLDDDFTLPANLTATISGG